MSEPKYLIVFPDCLVAPGCKTVGTWTFGLPDQFLSSTSGSAYCDDVRTGPLHGRFALDQ